MPKQSTTRRAAVYCRISNDPQGREAGVKRQETDCRALARQRGWKVAEVYTDNDISGWSGAERPAYRKLLADIEAGQVEAVVFWKLDRLTRRVTEFSRFYEACQSRGVEFVSCKEPIDTTSPISVGVVHLLASVGEQESQNTSDRLRRALEDKAKQGVPSGGGKRAFGYERDGLTVRADEAELIHEAVSRVLAGEGLIGVAHDFNQRGISTTGGGTWSTRTLKRILTAPRWAGLREHKGEVVGPAAWPAIIDQATHEKLKALLLDPKRRKSLSTARKYLLPGLAFCGLCGEKLASRSRGNSGSPCYQCVSVPPHNGCGKVSSVMAPVDELVRGALFEALDDKQLRKAMAADSGDDRDAKALLDVIRQDEEALEQLAKDHYSERLITRAEFLEARRAIEERLERSKRDLAQRSQSDVMASVPSTRRALEEAWNERGLEWRRALLSAVFDRVVIHPPAVRGRNWFDPERVELVWKV